MFNWFCLLFQDSCRCQKERLEKMLAKHPSQCWYHESSCPVPVMGDDWHIRHNRRAQHYGREFWSNPLAEHPADLLHDCPVAPLEVTRKEREDCQLCEIHEPGQVTFADLAK